MRITHVPYTKKRVTTLDLVQTDEVLYRDEEWLARDKDTPGLNTRYTRFTRDMGYTKCIALILSSIVIGGTPVIAEEVSTSGSGSDPANMGAAPQEHAETGPLVPCKVNNVLTLDCTR